VATKREVAVMNYPYEDGSIIADAAMDAVAMLFEYDESPELLAVSVTLVARDDNGDITTCCQTWSASDDDDD
jgi:hypothetical protein